MTQRRGPAGPALADPAGRRALGLLTGIAVLRAVGLVLVAEALARGIVGLADGRSVTAAICIGIVGALLRGAAAWAQRSVGARAAVAVKTSLRAGLVDRAISGSGRALPLSDGALSVTATRSLDDLDDYYTAVLPSLAGAFVVPLLLGVRIAVADPISALVLVITVPLVPVFMILIGKYTEGRVAEAMHSLDQLSTNLVELVRGLPVLIGLGRVRAQTRALADMSESYRRTTMQTLRTAFLSALALEFISTISVALVAVFIGVRLVNGTMDLESGLLALILAPEVFLPLRQLGAAFHSSENGAAARDRAQEIIDAPAESAAVPQSAGTGDAAPIVIAGLRVAYGGGAPALDELSADIGPGLTVVTGASGAGKSTLLGVLTGAVRPGDGTEISGSVSGMPGDPAFAGQAPRTYAATAQAELSIYAGRDLSTDEASVLLERAGLDLPADFPCAAMSPGELRRLALARALSVVDAGSGVLLVDEPTAHLDFAAAQRVRDELAAISRSVPVIAATHDASLIAAADAQLALGGGSSDRGPESADGPELHAAASPADAAAGHVAAPEETDDASPHVSVGVLLGRLGQAVGIGTWRFWLSVLLGFCAAAAASALIALSGWLIVRAAAQPPIMYLLVAIVGVRFFGISRSVLAYAKQLCLHDAVLSSLARLREAVWVTFARTGTANRTLLRGERALRRLISDVDDIRDLAPRVVLPPLVGLLMAIAAIGVEALVHPAAGLLMAAGVVVALVVAPAVALWADARASTAKLGARAQVLDGLARLLWAREDLIAAGRAPGVAAQVRSADARTARFEATAARAEGIGEGIVTVCGVLSGVLMLAVLGPAVHSGALSPEMLAVAALLPLSLIDPFVDALFAVQLWPSLASVLRRVPELDARGTADEDADEQRAARRDIEHIELNEISARWPGMNADVFSGLSADIDRGAWTAVTGPSGAGKTTLVSVLLRFLDPRTGSYFIDGEDALPLGAAELDGSIAWCPQEAHVFDSSLRANLLLARPRDDAPTEAEMVSVLDRVGLGELRAERGLDEQIGAGGARLSGGQRQRLAVARTLLAGASVVVLDEPTAHLDEPTARAVMDDLRSGLAGAAVVLVTHDPSLIRAGDRSVSISPVSTRT